MSIDHALAGEMDGNLFDYDDEGYDDNDDEDYLLYQLVQNAIEKKLIQVQNDLEELMLIQQLKNDGDLVPRDEEEEKDDGNHHHQEEEDCGVTMSKSMSMNVDNHKKDGGTTESDSSSSCSNTHPTKEDNTKNELAKHDRRSYLSSTTKFTNADYNNIHHRMNCTSSSSRRRYRHRITDGISLLDAVEKWRKMRQHYWKLFDIPIHDAEYDVSIEAGSGSTPSSQTVEDVDGTGYYYYEYIPNPDLYVDWISSSSSSEASSNTSAAATSSPETTSRTKRGLFAARDFKRGEAVYTQRDNALYFQELSAWEMYLQSLHKSSSTSSNTTDTISQYQEEVSDACLAIEWSFMKRISRPGRWLVMLVLDEGVYMRRKNVATTTPTTATTGATAVTSTTTTNGKEEEVDGDSDDNDEEDDDEDEWLDGNVQLYDERGLDFVALRKIRKGEEIIDAGPDIED